MAIVRGGLIQMSLKASTDKSPEEIRKAMLDAHLPLIEEAGKKGVQVLCFQEVFTQPYFCPSQDSKWYAAAEAIPDGPTTRLMQELAKKHQMVIVVPIYEEAMTGVYYNTAAVIDADGSYLGKTRKTHIPQVAGFWEKFFFKPGNTEYPVYKTRYCKLGVYICYDRHVGPQRRRIHRQPLCDRRRTLGTSVEARAACFGGREWLLYRRGQSRGEGSALEYRRVLRPELLREPTRPDRGDRQPRQGRAHRP
jgi:predicted amidohydrolase